MNGAESAQVASCSTQLMMVNQTPVVPVVVLHPGVATGGMECRSSLLLMVSISGRGCAAACHRH